MAAERYMERAAEIDRAIVAESARWGDASNLSIRSIVTPTGCPRSSGCDSRTSAPLGDPARSLRDRSVPGRQSSLLERFRTLLCSRIQPRAVGARGTIYFTLDGSDPRLERGAVAIGGDLHVDDRAFGAVHIRARARVDTTWSALSEATLGPEVSLRVTELMFHPAAPPPASPYDDEDFEFVEIANVGDAAIDLAGLRFSEGIDFELAGGVLAAGARALLVRDQAAFESRYGTALPVVGEYSGKLANEGERVRIETDDGEVPISPTTTRGTPPPTVPGARGDRRSQPSERCGRGSTDGKRASLSVDRRCARAAALRRRHRQ
jgi:hypothetical protein